MSVIGMFRQQSAAHESYSSVSVLDQKERVLLIVPDSSALGYVHVSTGPVVHAGATETEDFSRHTGVGPNVEAPVMNMPCRIRANASSATPTEFSLSDQASRVVP